MDTNSLFRKEALDKQYKERWVSHVISFDNKFINYQITMLMILVAASIYLSRYSYLPVSYEYKASLLVSNYQVVAMTEPGTIKNIKVFDGQRVNEGDELYSFTDYKTGKTDMVIAKHAGIFFKSASISGKMAHGNEIGVITENSDIFYLNVPDSNKIISNTPVLISDGEQQVTADILSVDKNDHVIAVRLLADFNSKLVKPDRALFIKQVSSSRSFFDYFLKE